MGVFKKFNFLFIYKFFVCLYVCSFVYPFVLVRLTEVKFKPSDEGSFKNYGRSFV